MVIDINLDRDRALCKYRRTHICSGASGLKLVGVGKADPRTDHIVRWILMRDAAVTLLKDPPPARRAPIVGRGFQQKSSDVPLVHGDCESGVENM
jgi:hypothetical protein